MNTKAIRLMTPAEAASYPERLGAAHAQSRKVSTALLQETMALANSLGGYGRYNKACRMLGVPVRTFKSYRDWTRVQSGAQPDRSKKRGKDPVDHALRKQVVEYALYLKERHQWNHRRAFTVAGKQYQHNGIAAYEAWRHGLVKMD
jgi:hypothetical protein